MDAMQQARLGVFIVEDHEFQRRTLVRLFEGLPVSVLGTAANGREALSQLRARDAIPDIVVTDLDMPEMDGIELIRHLSEQHLARAVIIASGLEPALLYSVEQMARAYGLQVLGNLEKPLTRERLRALFETYLPGPPPEAPDAHAAVGAPSPGEMAQALHEGRILTLFQPKVELASGRLVGCEALARWRRNGEALEEPKRFLPALEQAGLMDAMTDLMLERAARQWAQWARSGLRLNISVNVSMQSLADVSTADRYDALVRRCGAQPRDITIELTETQVMAEAAKALDVLTRLRLKEFGLSIDDFGIGFSSMQQLSKIPFSELKIDQGFVHQCDGHARLRAIVEASLDLARRLRLKTVAEGVETLGEWELLRDLGCDQAQGWLIAHAMSGDEFARWAEHYAAPCR